jgi:hypothetical protein
MKRNFFNNLLLLVLTSCLWECNKANDNSLNNVIFNMQVDPKTSFADGTSIVNVSCELNADATGDRTGVLFKLNTGQFVSNKDTTLVQPAQYVNGHLIARAAILMPLTAANIIVTAQPNLPNVSNNSYIQKDTIILNKSVPATIKLSGSAPAISANYKSEITITGLLANSTGGKVSTGAKVVFEDFLPGGIPANGTFRMVNINSDMNSQVSGIYSIGNVTLGTKISIVCTVLNDLGQKTSVGDTLTFIVNN